MAKNSKISISKKRLNKVTLKRKGRHSKKRTSKLKSAKYYKKTYRGQGR